MPDLAGCVAADSSIEDVAANIHDTIALHVEMMNEQGEDVPVLSSQVVLVDVAPESIHRSDRESHFLDSFVQRDTKRLSTFIVHTSDYLLHVTIKTQVVAPYDDGPGRLDETPCIEVMIALELLDVHSRDRA